MFLVLDLEAKFKLMFRLDNQMCLNFMRVDQTITFFCSVLNHAFLNNTFELGEIFITFEMKKFTLADSDFQHYCQIM